MEMQALWRGVRTRARAGKKARDIRKRIRAAAAAAAGANGQGRTLRDRTAAALHRLQQNWHLGQV
jgi:hypothetical protein